MRNKKQTISGNYMTAWDSRWKNPCILEHCLVDERKTQKLVAVLKRLNMRLQPYTDNQWFDVVKAS